MAKPHVLILPCPAQGHVMPAMELAQRLAKQGAKVTFINIEATHKFLTESWLETNGSKDLVHMVSVPDGLEPSEDRSDSGKIMESMRKSMPSKLEELIETINKQDDNKITCFIVDFWLAWALQVAKKMGIKRVTFSPASAATLATVLSIPKLVDDGFISSNGIPQKSEMIRFTEAMPLIKPVNLLWASVLSTNIELFFQIHLKIIESAPIAEWFICNSVVELEPAAFSLFPEVLPIGPLLASSRLAGQVGHFWPEDSTCLAWLDQQLARSVIYIAHGSITLMNQTQFKELALGLELLNQPFLWVVRPGMTNETTPTFPDDYMNRVGSRGRFVSWAPQQKVLAHRSIACFMTHCGWNSILEGVTNGLPFLCWPYFADQFYNETYICDIWKNGLGFKKDEAGIITRGEIKSKVEQLLGNKMFESKALEIKEKVASSVTEGGCSHNNLTKFIEWIYT